MLMSPPTEGKKDKKDNKRKQKRRNYKYKRDKCKED